MPDTNQIQLTKEGLEKLQEELAWREGEHAKEITDAIKTAKDFGDLSENAEYDAAKEDQAKNEARVAEIRSILANAQIVEKTGTRMVSIGSKVKIKDVKAKKDIELSIVGTTETHSLKNMISNESPIGAALMGHKKGDVVVVEAPNNTKKEYEIIAIGR